MKKSYILLIAIIIIFSMNVFAEHISLTTSGFLSIKKTDATDPYAATVKFDLSAIPSDVMIDLAELRITIDSDSTKSKVINIVVHTALSEWASSEISDDVNITTSDTLVTNNFSRTGDNKFTEFNVTELVKLWHSGELDNNGFLISILGSNDKKMKLKKIGTEPQVELSIYYSK